MSATNAWVVYILRCADNSLYTGISTDIERRLQQHNGERPGGARYTAPRRPVELLYQESYDDRSTASRREAAIKKLSRRAKQSIIEQYSGPSQEEQQ